MATAIQIEVMVDDKGVVQGVNKINESFDKVPGHAQRAFRTVTSEEKKAHEAALLLSETLGVQIPRALEKVIAKAPGVSTALSAAFKVSAVAAFVVALGEGLRNIDAIKGKLVNLAYDVGAGFEGLARKAAGLVGADLPKSFTALADRMKALDDEKALEPVVDRLNAINAAAQMAGTEGIAQLRAQLAATNKELEVFQHKFNLQIEQQFGIGTNRTAELQGRAAGKVNQMLSASQQATNKQIGKLTTDTLFSASQARMQAAAGAAKGEQQIELEHQAKLAQIRQQENKTGVFLLDEYVAANTERETKITGLHRAASDQIFEAEQKAAVASASEWERSNKSIVADFEAREREIKRDLRDTVIDENEANRLREANWKETNARIAQDYASQFESLFNDISSGGIGQRFKSQIRKLGFELAGELFAGLQGRRQGRNPVLAAIGSMLGIGGLGSGVPLYGDSTISYPGTGPYGLPPGVAMEFGDSGSFGFGLGSVPSGFGGVFSGGGGGGSATGPVDPGMSAPVGGASSGVRGILGRLLSPGSLSKLAPIALLGGLQLGMKGGNRALVAGGLIGAGGLAALYGPNAALTSAVAPFAGLLGPLAGGLVGFGLGTQYGPVAGGIGGAGTGALVGLLAAGPIGAAIGGIIGGLTGLFSGIFGRKPSKHSQADKWLQANVLPLIGQELTGYEGFGVDYATAINDLERLKSQSYDQMRSQFGKDATNDEWGRYIVPAIKSAEDRINADQAERNRRSTLQFGAPQFAAGGQFRVAGGSGLALLHDEEVVMSKRAVRTFGAGNLLAMNAAAQSGGGGGIGGVNVYLRADSVDERWLNNGGAVAIARAIRKAQMEGHAA